MEICEKAEIFVDRGNDSDLEFHHSKLILRSADGEYFYAKTDQRVFQFSQIDVGELDAIQIPSDRIWPLANATFTQAPEPLPSDCYLKRPSLLYYDDTSDSHDCCDQILNKVKACEMLRLYPHPNIAQYLGIVVKDSRVRGICFAKYSRTLSQMLKEGTPFQRDVVLGGIKAGIQHMHGLGLVHNNLHLSNIIMDGETPIIIDFDSCKQEGDKMGSKAGNFGRAVDGKDFARRENDLYSLSKIQVALATE
jgi:hypothetical protein